MKNRKSTAAVHPLSSSSSFLPSAILTLAAALSPADKDVLAYLISCSSSSNHLVHDNQNMNTKNMNKNAHSPVFSCDCFGCYTSYWARWDASPNRQLIHHIIDAFEQQQQDNNNAFLFLKDNNNSNNNNNRTKRNKKKNKKRPTQRVTHELALSHSELPATPPDFSTSIVSSNNDGFDGGEVAVYDDDIARDGYEEKGSVVRKLVGFIREIFEVFGPN